MTRNQIITAGTRLIDSLRSILPHQQARIIAELLRGEEGEYFHDLLLQLSIDLKDAPKLYSTDSMGDSAPVYFHYFNSSSDWWITEIEFSDGRTQAMGFVCLNGWADCAEFGSIYLPEILRHPATELDLHWDRRTTLRSVKKEHGFPIYDSKDDDESPENSSDSLPSSEPLQAERSASPSAPIRIPNGFII
jgi:hypothetical protein